MNTEEHNNSFTIWNFIFLSLASFLIARVLYIYKFDSEIFIPEYFTYLGFGLPAILLVFQYRQLRKLTVFTPWLILSFILFIISFILKYDTTLVLKSGNNAALILKGPFAFLLNYFILNHFSKKIYGTQLDLPSRTSMYNSEAGRNNNVCDYLGVFLGLLEVLVMGIV